MGPLEYLSNFHANFEMKEAQLAKYRALREMTEGRATNTPFTPEELSLGYLRAVGDRRTLKEYHGSIADAEKPIRTQVEKTRQRMAIEADAAAKRAGKKTRAREKKRTAREEEAAARREIEAAEKAKEEAEAARTQFEADQANYEKDLARFETAHKKWKETARAERRAAWDSNRHKLVRALTPGSGGYADLIKFRQKTSHLPTWRKGEDDRHTMDELNDTQWARLATTADSHGIPVPRAIQHYIRKPDPSKPKKPEPPESPKE